MKTIHLRAPATTANVGPGYDIFAMALAEPYDEIGIELNDTGTFSIEMIGDKQNIPVALEDNTAGLALLELQRRYRFQAGAHVRIIKHITSGCGMGTTGASAAGVVFGMNQLLGLGLRDNEMIDVSRMGEVASGGSPHADNVAAALLGGFVLVKSYQPIDVLKLEMPPFPLVLAVIKKSLRTTRGFITYEIGQEKLKDQMARCASVIHAIYQKDAKEFGKAISVDHIAEPVRSASVPEYAELKKNALETGAFGFNISGGGSSVFAVCPEERQDAIASLMEESLHRNPNFVCVVKTSVSNSGVSVMQQSI